ncbi:hypothetical protein OSCI_580031 [Kamptonema sp. PCC 6506]|nr:hypothetical protein OSCI_580031 [Kamptonema sp. PCC 6506]
MKYKESVKSHRIVFYETELFYKTAFDSRTLDGDSSVLRVSDRLHLARCVFLEHRSNG